MNKKFYLLSSSFCLGLATIPIAIAGTNNISKVIEASNTNTYPNYDDIIANSLDSLIIVESIEKTNNILEKNSFLRADIEINVAFFEENLEFNEKNFISEKLMEYGVFENYKKDTINRIYDLYLSELNEGSENHMRCGSIFKGHFWSAVAKEALATSISALAPMWWFAQAAVGIYSILTMNGGAAADAFASFSSDIPDYMQKWIAESALSIKKFSQDTQCKWTFKIFCGNRTIKIHKGNVW